MVRETIKKSGPATKGAGGGGFFSDFFRTSKKVFFLVARPLPPLAPSLNDQATKKKHFWRLPLWHLTIKSKIKEQLHNQIILKLCLLGVTYFSNKENMS